MNRFRLSLSLSLSLSQCVCVCVCVCVCDSKYSLLAFRTSLESLGLVSLELIENGDVAIVGNARLCYVSAIPWQNILRSPNQSRLVRANMPNDACGIQQLHSQNKQK